MKLVPKVLNLDTLNLDSFLLDESPIEKAINLMSRSLIEKRESQILDALRESGYVFENNYQFQKFAEEMCTVFTFQENNRKILKVGSEMICEWDDTFYCENNGNEIKAGFGLKD